MIEGIFIGIVATVVGELILYYGFGIGKDKKPLKLARALRIDVDSGSPSFSSGATGRDGLAQIFIINVGIKFSNLSTKVITIRNIRPTLELPEGYTADSITTTNFHNSVDIATEGYVIINYICSVQISGSWNGGANEQNPVWVENRNKILGSLQTAKVIFKLVGDCVSNDESIKIDETLDFTKSIIPQIKR